MRLRNAWWPRLGAGILALSWLVSCEINKLLQDGGASDPLPARLEFTPPADAAQLAFTAQPHGAMVDSVLTPPVQVTAFDTLGNVAAGFAENVTVALAANSSGGTLGGTTTATAASGVATFADLSVNRAGRGYRLTASAGQLAGATSDSSFDITAA